MSPTRADPRTSLRVDRGPEGSESRPERFIAMLNAERSPTFYRRLREHSRCLAIDRRRMPGDAAHPVITLAHLPATEAYPSRTDISYALRTHRHYVLCPPAIPAEPRDLAATASSTGSSPE